MKAVAFYNSSSHPRPFVKLETGEYRWLKTGWEATSPPVHTDGPTASWVESGLRSGDVVELEVIKDLTLHIVNSMITA